MSGLGQPPFDPRMMVALLLHGYASGLYSSRRIARACRERNDFVMIVALDPPDFRTISDFRKRHLKALGALFLQVLKLCETAGLVKLGHVALDGTKIKANASKHKAMSYERMKKREAELKAEVARMLAAAEAADAQEDETFGPDKKRGDEMPDWAGDKQKRLAKIQQAMAALEADARLAAEEERRIEAEKEKQRQAEGRKKPGKPRRRHRTNLIPSRNTNFTDPESRIMKSKDGFVQAYNAQAAVDAGAQIIVAHELTQCGNDQGQLLPLIEATENNLGRNYQPNTFGESPRESPQHGFTPFADAEQGPKRRLRAESFADHYSQARQFFISQTRGEQAHIVAALTFELSKVKTPAIRERMVSHLLNIDETSRRQSRRQARLAEDAQTCRCRRADASGSRCLPGPEHRPKRPRTLRGSEAGYPRLRRFGCRSPQGTQRRPRQGRSRLRNHRAEGDGRGGQRWRLDRSRSDDRWWAVRSVRRGRPSAGGGCDG